MRLLYSFFKFFVFKINPEIVHDLTLFFFSKFPWASALFCNKKLGDKYKTKIGELELSFPVGIAAGLDENGVGVDFLTRLNIGSLEVGTVTPLPQFGNDKPRLFRLIPEESLRNRMGFNNQGSEAIYENIAETNKNGKLLGVNLGKNKITSQEEAPEDYRKLYDKFAKIADYLVINISSPNTPGLRTLQGKEFFEKILSKLDASRKELSKPLFVKISPDLSFEQIDEVIDLVKKYKLSGIIATNTTIISEIGEGGISGRLLSEKSEKVRNYILSHVKDEQNIQLIGVGGIFSFDDIWTFWKNGGKAVQIYSSFIYEGPQILVDIRKEIDRVLQLNDYNNLQELFDNISTAKR